ncbi:MAG: LysM peptidoglycan-binding domain-containing protein [Bacteroidota bacterium]
MGIRIKLLLVFGFAWTAFAQDWVPIVEQKGKVFHAVVYKSGMSLVAMLQSTNTPSDTFKRDNPTVTDEVVEGTELYFRVERKDQKHRVASGDTPFAIAKKFAIPLDSLYASNPELLTVPLKVGQQVSVKGGVVRYPTTLFAVPNGALESSNEPTTEEVYRSFSFEDTVLNYQVRNGETMSMVAKRFLTTPKKLKAYNGLSSNSLNAGMTLKIPIEKDSIVPSLGSFPPAGSHSGKKVVPPMNRYPYVHERRGKDYKMAVFLPLGGDTCRFPLRGYSKNALDFYMGALLAVDSLDREGCSGEVRFFDYASEQENVAKVIASGELKSYNVVIGPWHPSEIELLSTYCSSHAIPFVLPTPYSSPTIKENAYAFGTATEIESQLESMCKLASERTVIEQVVLYAPKIPADTLRENLFMQGFNRLNKGNKRLIVADASTLKALLKSGKPILVFCVSLDKAKVVELTSWVKNSSTNNKLVGLKEWTDWKEVNASIKNESDFYYFSTGCVDYSKEQVKKVHRRFRSKYGLDFSRYAMLGFDIVQGFSSWGLKCGNTLPYHGLMLAIDYVKTDHLYHSNYALELCRFREFKTEKNAKLDE